MIKLDRQSLNKFSEMTDYVLRAISSKKFAPTMFKKMTEELAKESVTKITSSDYKVPIETAKMIGNFISKKELLFLYFLSNEKMGFKLPILVSNAYRADQDYRAIEVLLNELVSKRILLPDYFGSDDVFLISDVMINYFQLFDDFEAYVYGFNKIVDNISKSMLLFELLPDQLHEDFDVGTGFLLRYKGSNVDEYYNIAITNKHVVFDEKNQAYRTFRIFSSNKNELKSNRIIIDNRANNDIAAIVLDNDNGFENTKSIDFYANTTEVLDEIIVLGYPPISGTTNPYLTVHKGEVNAIVNVKGYTDDIIVYSAKTFPGNSGGPLINEFGKIIGIVVESAEFKTKSGKQTEVTMSYFFAQSSWDMITFVNEQVLKVLQKDK
jgi:S1-C subfamily serine protease